MTAQENRAPGFNARRSAPQRRWSSAPIIDGQALVVSRTPRPAPGFSSQGRASRSSPAGGFRDVGASPRASFRSRPRTLLWTAPVGLAIAGVLFALALFAAPDRPVAEPLVRAALLNDGGSLQTD